MRQDDLPLLQLILLSSHLPETHLVLCVFSKGTSVHCTKHDISQHWLHKALGDTQKQLSFFFLKSHILVPFIYLNAPRLSLLCLCFFPLASLPFPSPLLIPRLQFVSLNSAASRDLFVCVFFLSFSFEDLQHLLLKVMFTVKEEFA